MSAFAKIVSFAKAHNCSHLSFTGGEPTLHPKFPEIMRVLAENNLKFSMVTNGWNFLDFHENMKPYVTLVKRLDFSLDGATAEVHDLNRTKGSYQRVVQAATICNYKGIPFGLRTAVTKRNMHQLEGMALLAAKVGAKELTLGPVQPTSRTGLELFLHPEDLTRVTNEVLRLQKIFKMKMTMTTGYYHSDPLAMCHPLTMKELFINSKGQITFCCQLTDYQGAENGTEVVANLDEVNLYEAHQAMADAVAKYQKDKIQRLAEGKLGDLDYFPCWYCLKYFRKVDWLRKFPDTPWSQDLLKSESEGREETPITLQKGMTEYQQESKRNVNGSTFQANQKALETILSKDEGLLIHSDTHLSYALNRTGLKIWSLLKEGLTVDEMAEKLQDEFEVDRDRAKKDVVSLIQGLLSLKLILSSNQDRIEREVGSA
jgi:hypothetical protein